MCGIAGFIGDFQPSLLGKMQAAIAHRGPDDGGKIFFPESGVGLAHTRLSIIDLSPRGRQPMWDTRQQACITFNGEIYNYRELKNGLLADGYTFNSDSDTEVILNLYLRDGADFLPKLNGIFAFAIWDSRNSTLLIVRDGMGVKPLYIARSPLGLLFASEIKALLHEPSVSRDIDLEAVQQYITYLYAPAPFTPLKSVRKLEAGQALWINARTGQEKTWIFYDIPYDQKIMPLGETEAISDVRRAIDLAVERQMVSDVPVGAFLSGGVDSSAIVASARKHAKIPCFTISNDVSGDTDEGRTSDLPYARKVAEHLGVSLEVVDVSPDMWRDFAQMIFHVDEPSPDLAALNVYYISKRARDMGIKVLLSGAGGDDIFSGYKRHYALMQEHRFANWPQGVKKAVGMASHLLPASIPQARRAAKFAQYLHLEGDARIASYFYWLNPARVQKLFRADIMPHPGRVMEEALARLPAGTPALNKMLYLDSKFFLSDHNLNYTDKMSMAAGVEVRVPFLDPDLVSLAARLPINLKQQDKEGKYILKRSLENVLPRDIIYRKKAGFGVPLRSWMKGPLRDIVDAALSPRALGKRGIFNVDEVQNLLAADRAGKIDASYPLFALVALECWMQIFIDREVPGV